MRGGIYSYVLRLGVKVTDCSLRKRMLNYSCIRWYMYTHLGNGAWISLCV